jgi:hypothetical protein
MAANDRLLPVSDDADTPSVARLMNLTPWQVSRIDRLLTDIGPYGEVRIIKEKGRVTFVEKVESIKIADGPTRLDH